MKLLQRMVSAGHRRSCQRCNDWSGQRVAALRPQSLLDVGCADGSFLFQYLDSVPKDFHGIEAAPALREKAESRGLKVAAVDLNGPWPYPDNTFEQIGFSGVEVSSMGLMPLPDWLGRPLEKWMYRRGHLLLVQARKPRTAARN